MIGEITSSHYNRNDRWTSKDHNHPRGLSWSKDFLWYSSPPEFMIINASYLKIFVAQNNILSWLWKRYSSNFLEEWSTKQLISGWNNIWIDASKNYYNLLIITRAISSLIYSTRSWWENKIKSIIYPSPKSIKNQKIKKKLTFFSSYKKIIAYNEFFDDCNVIYYNFVQATQGKSIFNRILFRYLIGDSECWRLRFTSHVKYNITFSYLMNQWRILWMGITIHTSWEWEGEFKVEILL